MEPLRIGTLSRPCEDRDVSGLQNPEVLNHATHLLH